LPCACAPGASVMVCGGPPRKSIFRSFPPWKNAIERLSGDQKGVAVRDVGASGSADVESSERTQSRSLPSGAAATKASRSPSGEIEWKPNDWPLSGGGTRKRTVRSVVEPSGRSRIRDARKPRPTPASSSPTIQSRRHDRHAAGLRDSETVLTSSIAAALPSASSISIRASAMS
jgi:hypothetical protein